MLQLTPNNLSLDVFLVREHHGPELEQYLKVLFKPRAIPVIRHQTFKIRIGREKNFSEPDRIHLVGTEEVKGAGINSLPGGQKQVKQ